MIRSIVSVSAESYVHDTVVQQQRRALILMQGLESNYTIERSIPVSWHASLNLFGTAELFRSRREIEGVEVMEPVNAGILELLSLGHDIQRVSRGIDYGTASNSDFGRNIAAFVCVVRGHSGNGRPIYEGDMPQRIRLTSVGIECIHAVVLCRDIDHIVRTLSGNVHIRDI